MINRYVAYVDAQGRLTDPGAKLFADIERRVTAAEAKLTAIAAVVAPTGGATIDAESRAAINAIIAGAS